MDSTHGTNTYDFNLTTILVIDEFREGIPVGWAISNREHVTLLVKFFKASKNKWNLLPNLIAYIFFNTNDFIIICIHLT